MMAILSSIVELKVLFLFKNDKRKVFFKSLILIYSNNLTLIFLSKVMGLSFVKKNNSEKALYIYSLT